MRRALFSRLLLLSLVAVSCALFLAVVVTDEIYLDSLKSDELKRTQGIYTVVSNALAEDSNRTQRDEITQYWQQQFDYQMQLLPIDQVGFTPQQITQLTSKGRLAVSGSSWSGHSIYLYYLVDEYACVLQMTRSHSFAGLMLDHHHLLGSYFMIVLVVGIFVYLYTRYVSNQVRKLSSAYEEYGSGNFDARAEIYGLPSFQKLAKTFNRMADRIDSLNREQQQLIQGVSHDFNTPLARMRFALDISRNCKTVEEFQNHIQQLDTDLDELEKLANEWLFYLRITGQSYKMTLDSCPIVEQVHASVEKLSYLYPHIEVDIQVEEVLIEAEPRLLLRCIENLVSNGFKYAHSKMRIVVRTGTQSVSILVEDDGPGIPEHAKSTVIQPFKRLDQSRHAPGFGLGLAIVKSIADMHGAYISVGDSSMGGAKLTLTFSRKKMAA